MKLSIYRVSVLTSLIFCLFCSFSNAQTPEVVKAQNAVNRVLFDSGVAFRDGLVAYEDKRLSDAGEKFNKSVEVFIYSNLNVQREPKLQGCYDKLVETVYRIEFPLDNRLPQVNNLAQTCNWNNLDAALKIDTAMGDRIANLAKSQVPKLSGTSTATVATNTTSIPSPVQVGFNSQEFEPSPLDDLAKLELTTDEQQIDNNPVAQQQYQYIQYAVQSVARIQLSGPPDDPAIHQLLSRPRTIDDGSWLVSVRNVHADGPEDIQGRRRARECGVAWPSGKCLEAFGTFISGRFWIMAVHPGNRHKVWLAAHGLCR